MQYSKRFAVVAAFAGLAGAQSQCLSDAVAIPACGLGYVASVAYYDFSCGLADLACDCSNLEGIANTAVPVIGNANAHCDVLEIYTSATNLCSCVTSYAPSSVTLNSVESACQASAAAIPPCALGYLASAGANYGCDINNFECQCENFDSIAAAILAPVQSDCGTQVPAVLASANGLCVCVTSAGAGVSVPITVSTVSTTTSGSVPTVSATPSVSSSVPSVTGVSTPSTSASLPAGLSSSESGSAGSSQSGTVAGSGSGFGSATAKATTSGMQLQSGFTGGTSSLPVFTGAGATASAFGGMIGVVAGLVAFL